MHQADRFARGRHGRRGSVPLLPLLLAALPLFAARARAAEFPVCTQASAQSAVDIAYADDVVLVVWQDERDIAGSGVNVYGALVSPAGEVLPPGEFAISSAAGNQTCPRAASDGTGFLVTWQDDQAGALELDVHAATVAADGAVGAPFVVSAAADRQKLPDAAWTGAYYVVAWEDERDFATTDWDIFAARVNAAGGVVAADAAGVKITTTDTVVQGSVAVAGAGGDALLVFRHGGGNDIKGAIVDSTGAVSVAPFGVSAAASTQKSPCAAFGNGIFLAAWEDYRLSATGPDVYVARIDSTGTVLGPTTNVNITNDTASRSAAPSVAFDGGNFVVTWEQGADGASDVHYARILADGAGCTVRGAGGAPLVTGVQDMDSPTIARAGAGVLAAWADYRNVVSDVYAVVVQTNDPPTAGTASFLPPAPNEGDTVTLATAGEADPEGELLSYEWTQTAGPAAALSDPAAASPTFTAPDRASDYALAFELRVSDGAGWSAPASIVIPVLADDDAPVADAGADYSVATLAQALLDGGGSYDPEGGPLTYSWAETSAWGVEISGADQPVAGFTAPGAGATLDFELTVSDGVNEATGAVRVTVSSVENPPPEASNVGIGTLTPDSASVVWDTDLAAVGSVRYGTTPALGTESTAGPSGTSHDVALSGLRSGTTYCYVVRSEGANGAWSLSEALTFTTDPPSPSEDTDLDGMPDAWEEAQGLDPYSPADAGADPDGDKLANLDEYRHGTDVMEYDTDGDGGSDGYEVLTGFDPTRADSVPPPEPPVSPSDGSWCSPLAAGGGDASAACALAALAFLAAALRSRRTSRE